MIILSPTSSGAPPQVWNPSQTNAAITISGAGLVLTYTAGTVQNFDSYALMGVTTGKYYWEIGNMSGSGWTLQNNSLGIGNTSSATNQILGLSPSTDTVALQSNGTIYYNSVAQASVTPGIFASWIQPVGIAFDAGAHLIWFRADPTDRWNNDNSADPATGTLGVAVPAGVFAAPMVPAVALARNGDVATANFRSSSWVGTPPAGYGPFVVGAIEAPSFSLLATIGIKTIFDLKRNPIRSRRRLLTGSDDR